MGIQALTSRRLRTMTVKGLVLVGLLAALALPPADFVDAQREPTQPTRPAQVTVEESVSATDAVSVVGPEELPVVAEPVGVAEQVSVVPPAVSPGGDESVNVSDEVTVTGSDIVSVPADAVQVEDSVTVDVPVSLPVISEDVDTSEEVSVAGPASPPSQDEDVAIDDQVTVTPGGIDGEPGPTPSPEATAVEVIVEEEVGVEEGTLGDEEPGEPAAEGAAQLEARLAEEFIHGDLNEWRTLLVLVINAGDGRAANTLLEYALQNDETLVAGESAEGSCFQSGDTLSCPIGALAPGDQILVKITLRRAVEDDEPQDVVTSETEEKLVVTGEDDPGKPADAGQASSTPTATAVTQTATPQAATPTAIPEAPSPGVTPPGSDQATETPTATPEESGDEDDVQVGGSCSARPDGAPHDLAMLGALAGLFGLSQRNRIFRR